MNVFCPVSETRSPKPRTSESMMSCRLPVDFAALRVRSVRRFLGICPSGQHPGNNSGAIQCCGSRRKDTLERREIKALRACAVGMIRCDVDKQRAAYDL